MVSIVTHGHAIPVIKYIFCWNLLHFYQLGLTSPDAYLGRGPSSAIRVLWFYGFAQFHPRDRWDKARRGPPVLPSTGRAKATPCPSPAMHEGLPLAPGPTCWGTASPQPQPAQLPCKAGLCLRLQSGSSQPHCAHVRAERLSCATLSWHLPPRDTVAGCRKLGSWSPNRGSLSP